MHSCHNSWAITNRGFSRGFLCFLFRLNFTIQAVIKKSPFRIFTSLFCHTILQHCISTLYFYATKTRSQHERWNITYYSMHSNRLYQISFFSNQRFQPALSNQFMPLTSCFVIHVITTRNLNFDLSTNNNMNQAYMNKLNCHNSS